MSKRLLRIGLIASIAVWIVLVLASMLSPFPAQLAGSVLCPRGWRMERETFDSRTGTSTHFTCFSPSGEEQDRTAAMLPIQVAFGLPVVIFAALLVMQTERDLNEAAASEKTARKRRDHKPGKLTAPLKELDEARKSGLITEAEFEERRKAILDKS